MSAEFLFHVVVTLSGIAATAIGFIYRSKYQQKKAMKEQVEDLEIRARKWKAEWEIMHYSMEVKKMMPLYDEFRKKQLEELQEALSKAQEAGVVEYVS